MDLTLTIEPGLDDVRPDTFGRRCLDGIRASLGARFPRRRPLCIPLDPMLLKRIDATRDRWPVSARLHFARVHFLLSVVESVHGRDPDPMGAE